jgi:hypothetical protein
MTWVYSFLAVMWAILAAILVYRAVYFASLAVTRRLLTRGLDFSAIGWAFYRVFMRKYAVEPVPVPVSRGMDPYRHWIDGQPFMEYGQHQLGWSHGRPYVHSSGPQTVNDLYQINYMLEYARRRWGSGQ